MNSPINSNQDDSQQVKINQQASSFSPPPLPTQPPVNNPPSTPQINDLSQNTGVGKPNIGVELEQNKNDSGTITVTSSKIDIPEAKPTLEPEIKEEESPKITDKTNQIDNIAMSNMPPNYEEKKPEVHQEKPNTSPVPSSNLPLVPPPTPDSNPTPAQEQNIPIKTYDSSKTTDHSQQPVIPPPAQAVPNPSVIQNIPPNSSPTQPPIKASPGSPAVTITVLALVALILGAGGGFFGFKYWDKIKISASENISSSPSTDTNSTENGLKIYSNTLHNFSLSFPSDWVASTENSSAEAVTFASNAESLSGDNLTGYRVEVTFENSGGKTLKNFVDAKAAASNEKGTIQEITVDGKTAYQQPLSNIRPAVATYVERDDKIMILTYSAKDNDLSSGAEFYNNLINSIKLN